MPKTYNIHDLTGTKEEMIKHFEKLSIDQFHKVYFALTEEERKDFKDYYRGRVFEIVNIELYINNFKYPPPDSSYFLKLFPLLLQDKGQS